MNQRDSGSTIPARARPAFTSILVDRPEALDVVEQAPAPACFRDLNLDQVVDAITAGREEYRLRPFFHAPLRDVEAIAYRHEILRDLERKPVRECVDAFARGMAAMRTHLAQAEKLYYPSQRKLWFLDAVAVYLRAVTELRESLARADATARGWLALGEYLAGAVESPAFRALVEETAFLQEALAGITYCLDIQGNRITVGPDEGDADYAMDVERTFERFKRGAVKDHRVTFPSWPEMNHIEAGILDRVALLHPDVFERLDDFCQRHRGYLDATLATFDRQVQFYVAYLDHVARLTAADADIGFCYPDISDHSKEVSASDTFDLALAGKLTAEHTPVVCNTFALRDPERIVVVTGPNQGGKTTFARTFGQLHYLASLGCPVPGRAARLFLPDRLLTHFEREEDPASRRGKLEDDLLRIHETLQVATPRSVVIMNEIFTSTTFRDALFLSREILAALVRLDLLCVCVTFLDELATLGPTTVSMGSTVAPHDPTARTYRIVRKPADGRAHAVAIAEKYGLSAARLQERLTS
jgi:DNA mismatch repair protein MutS